MGSKRITRLPATTAAAVSNYGEVGIVEAVRILTFRRDAVITHPTATEVVLLIVSRGFCKPEAIKFVVISVHHVEHLNDRSALGLGRKRLIAGAGTSGRRIPG